MDESSSTEVGQSHPRIAWPHAPVHRLDEVGTYIVTAGTYRKEHLFSEGSRLRLLHVALLTLAEEHGARLEAWAVFPNHYHFVAVTNSAAGSLRELIRELHSRTAIALNRHDGAAGRKVWHNFWDTRLTHERSYFARLNYVHQTQSGMDWLPRRAIILRFGRLVGADGHRGASSNNLLLQDRSRPSHR